MSLTLLNSILYLSNSFSKQLQNYVTIKNQDARKIKTHFVDSIDLHQAAHFYHTLKNLQPDIDACRSTQKTDIHEEGANRREVN